MSNERKNFEEAIKLADAKLDVVNDIDNKLRHNRELGFFNQDIDPIQKTLDYISEWRIELKQEKKQLRAKL